MATTSDGNRTKATANTVTAMRRSARNRACPSCGRLGAIKRTSENNGSQIVSIERCRWVDVKQDGLYPYCTYEKVTVLKDLEDSNG